MRNKSVWERACGLTETVVEGVEFDNVADAIVVSVRPVARARGRCGQCRRRSPRYDGGEGRRRWRALDLGTTRVFIEARAPRVRCRDHGVIVAAVPWARHRAGHTRDFDDAGGVARGADLEERGDGAAAGGVAHGRFHRHPRQRRHRRDDRSARGAATDRDRRDLYKRGHRYLIVVVDHDRGRLVWAGPGRNDAALNVFFDELGPERSALLTHVSADMADWIARVVARRAPNALRSADPFHVVAVGDRSARHRTTPGVERSQRSSLAPARSAAATPARPATPNTSPRSRYALWKNPGDLTRPPTPPTRLDRQDRPTTLARRTSSKKDCATCSRSKAKMAKSRSTNGSHGHADPASPRSCTSNAASSPTAPRSTSRSTTGLSQGLVESTNTKIRLLTRIAFGFHGYQPLIALAMLALGAHPPRLPGRN